MNSSTTSSDPHRRYVLGLMALVAGLLAGSWGLGIYLQPVQGDLTRIGAYPERQFGWNQPQPAYASPLGTLADYRQPVDLLVLGDSYSAGGWQYHLTGGGARSQLSLHFEQVTLEQILAHPRYQADPPQVLIYQVVERSLPVRLLSQPCDPVGARVPRPPHRWTLAAGADGPPLASQARSQDWRQVRLATAPSYLLQTGLRSLGLEMTDAVRLPLRQPAPFSSSIRDQILVFRGDLDKARLWEPMDLDEMACRIESLRTRVEANGRTRLVFMLAPDKLTAYAGWLGDPALARISRLAELAERLPGLIPRLDLALIQAIRAGQLDVYLPNDTHWGSAGFRIVAQVLGEFLARPAGD